MTVTYEPYKIKIIPLQKGKKNNKSYNNNKEKRREIARDVTSKKRENRFNMYKMGACVIAHKVSCRTHSVWTILPVQIIFNFYVRLAGTFSNICQIMGYFNLFEKMI